ncbi:hypothetical protein CR513_14051, partial [Mucuna pruriens]
MEGNTNRMMSLNDTNYHSWKGKMKDLLFRRKCIFLSLLFRSQNLCLMKNETLSTNKYVVLFEILWMIIEIHVSTLWEKIESLYASMCGNKKLFLLNSIVSLNFKEDTSLSNHMNEFQEILDQMSRMGLKFEDEILRLLLLNSLPEFWETFKVFIKNSTPNGVVSLQTAKDSVFNEETRRKTQGSSSRYEKKGRENSRSKFKFRYKNVEYHYCHKIRHIQKHCFLSKKENKGKMGKLKEKDHDNDDDRVTTTTTDDDLSVNLVFDESIGATLHVTPRNEFFTSYTLGDFRVLKIGNDDVTKVIGVDDVCLQTNMGVQLWIRGVKHAPDVHFNLIYVHMLNDGGYDNHFGYRKWKLTKDNLVVARREKISKLYGRKVVVAKNSVNAIDMEASLCH